MVDFKKLMAKKGGPAWEERPSTTCLGCGELPFISLGEAITGIAQCPACDRRIELTHEERWELFDYIDDKIDGLFTPEAVVTAQPVDDDDEI